MKADYQSKFKKDLDKLIRQGDLLRLSMRQELMGKTEFRKIFTTGKTKEEVDSMIEKIPKFSKAYEAWYSESLAMLKQVLPDRVSNFVSFYEKPKTRKSIEFGNYVIQDYLLGLRVTHFGETKVDLSAAFPMLEQQTSIVEAARNKFESSLFDIKQVVQSDLFDEEIDSAKELAKHKFYRAAGTIAGVILEKHLKQVCDNRKIIIAKKNPTINDFNELLKDNSVIDIAQWRFISFLGDLRNLCSHNKQVEPNETQASDLITGVDKILKTLS